VPVLMHGIKAGIIHRSTHAVLMARSFDGSPPRRIGGGLAPVTVKTALRESTPDNPVTAAPASWHVPGYSKGFAIPIDRNARPPQQRPIASTLPRCPSSEPRAGTPTGAMRQLKCGRHFPALTNSDTTDRWAQRPRRCANWSPAFHYAHFVKTLPAISRPQGGASIIAYGSQWRLRRQMPLSFQR
jgi:hypothetical protein